MKKVELIVKLKELTGKFQPKLFSEVRRKLNSRDAKVLDYVFENYYQEDKVSGRWYDPYHILFSTSLAIQLVRSGKQTSPLIIPSSILHDVGYCALADKTNLNNPWGRILHMQKGAALSAKALTQVGNFNADEIGIIVDMVATHDNWILGILIPDPDCLALIDADKIFVMNFVSFYKDWVGEEGKDLSVKEFFDSRWQSFHGGGMHSLSTNLAKQWSHRQFQKRQQEIQSNITEDIDTFTEYAGRAINSKAG